jgi:MFS family permease
MENTTMTAAAALTGRHSRGRSPWAVAARGAAALAAGVGVGRFVYTPILPLMHAQAGLSSAAGASLATANYVGYLAGALVTTFRPALVRSPAALRGALVILIATLALMPVTVDPAVWFALRLVAGAASAVVFVIAVSAMLTHLREHAHHLTGWAFGGVGGGIALTGALVLVVRSEATWQAAWWSSAILTVALTAGAWSMTPEPAPRPVADSSPGAAPTATPGAAPTGPGGAVPTVPGGANRPSTHRWFSALWVSYSLEGVGYIIAGTFLVAAIEQSSPGWLGSGAWVLVGIAAVPSSALWAGLAHRWSRPALLLVALVIQSIGIALPVLVGGAAAALTSAVLFGATFMGVGTISLAIGAQLRFPRAVALLTTGYSLGQIIGPLLVTPLLRHGYHQALLVGAGIVLAAALAAAALRVRFPHHVGSGVRSPARTGQPEAAS